jgi:starvation-inducible DNA-binding protein
MAITKMKSTGKNEPAIGLSTRERKEVAECLSHALSETYMVQLKTQYYHWNVKGPFFQSLHLLFEAQYDALALAVDELAERIRSLGATAPGTFEQFSRLVSFKEDKTLPSSWEAMVSNLVEANEAIIRNARTWLATAQKAEDEGSADLFIRRIQEHEKATWMLRSHLQ